MRRRSFLRLGLAGVGAAIGAGAVWRAFTREMDMARARVSEGSAVIQTSFGAMEFALAGHGPPVVSIHGTGGGFDQGLAIGRRLAAAGRQVISPSRFGYLRSDNPTDPSPEHQADAIAELLVHLRVEQASVIGVSAGALTALAFAIRHRTRCNALVALVPASYAPGRAPAEISVMQRAIMEYGLKSDFLFWAGAQVAEDAMVRTLLATDPRLVANAASSERARARTILREILPVSERARGLLNDAAQAGVAQPMPIQSIVAPTLAISLEDDLFGTADAARHIAATVQDARLVIYPSGGHVWIGHDAEVFEEIDAFLPRE